MVSTRQLTTAFAVLLLAFATFAERAPVAAAALYARLTRRDVLAHPRRDAVLRVVRERPGLTMSELQRALGLSTGTTLYHVAVLVRERHLVRVDSGATTRLFLPGHASPAALREEALRMDGAAGAHVLVIVQEEPGVRAVEIARRLGKSHPAAHKAIARLERHGLLVKRRAGRRVGLHPADATGAVRRISEQDADV